MPMPVYANADLVVSLLSYEEEKGRRDAPFLLHRREEKPPDLRHFIAHSSTHANIYHPYSLNPMRRSGFSSIRGLFDEMHELRATAVTFTYIDQLSALRSRLKRLSGRAAATAAV